MRVLVGGWKLALPALLFGLPFPGWADATFPAPDRTPAPGYEAPPTFAPGEVLPEELLRGPYHSIERRVRNDGYLNHYVLRTPYGPFRAASDSLVRERIREAGAVAALQRIKGSEAYADGLAAAAEGPLTAAQSLLYDPVGTIREVPGGVGRYFRNIAQSVHGGRGEREDSFAQELIGFSDVKREYARALRVDPYSSNAVLQQELNDVAWASFAGGLPVKVALALVPGGAGIAISAVKWTGEFSEMVYDESPASLRRINRDRMNAMGMSPDDMQALLTNPKYTPRHETGLVAALYRMSATANRRAYVRLAAGAEEEAGALYFQRTAQLLSAYHRRVAPVERLVVWRRLAFGVTGDKVLVLPMAVDYLIWSEDTATIARAVAEQTTTEMDVDRVEVWVTGRLSPRTKDEMTALDFTTYEHAFDRLRPARPARR